MKRHYEKEYAEFFFNLAMRLQNQHDMTAISLDKESIYKEIAYPLYPIFNGVYKKQKFSIRLAYTGAEHCFEVIFRCDTDRHLKVRRQTKIDKFWLKLRLSSEFDSQNQEFNKKYFITNIKSDADKQMINDVKLQELILDCEPFDFFEILSNSIFITFYIKDVAEIDLKRVESSLPKLYELLRYFDKSAL